MDANVFDHEKLIVYQRAREFLATAAGIIRQLPKGSGDVADQLRRAARSVLFNIAEGAGRRTGSDKARFYDHAQGSAAECAAAVDAVLIEELAPVAQAMSARQMLVEIVKMLVVLARRAREREG